MATLPVFPADDLRTLNLLFQLKLADRIDALDDFAQESDEDAYRAALSKEYPLFAKRFEQMTQERIQEVSRFVAIGEAVAYTIHCALDRYARGS